MIINADGASNANKVVLLWENPDVTKSFESQVVNVDTSSYSVFFICMCSSTSSTSVITDVVLSDIDSVQTIKFASGVVLYYRYVTVTEDGLSFGSGQTLAGTTTGVGDSVVIPYRIYGS